MFVRRTQLSSFVLLAVPLLAGCAATESTWRDELTTELTERIGAGVTLPSDSSTPATEEDPVRALLAEPLTADRAFQVALLQNRTVRILLADVGIADAELAASGLFSNPIADVELRFFGAGLNVEAGIAQSLVGLILAPRRERIATEVREGEKARVAAAIIGMAADIRGAYIEHLAARAIEQARATASRTRNLAAEFTGRLHRSGNEPEIEAILARLEAEEAALAKIAAEAEVRRTRERLNLLMGLDDGDSRWTVAGELPELPHQVIDAAEAEGRAVCASLDLRRARHELDAASYNAGMGRWEVLAGEAEVGARYEREAEGDEGFGPSLAFPIPLFSRGSAELSAAEWEVRRRAAQYEAEAARVRAFVRGAQRNMETARLRAERLRNVVMPLRTRLTHELTIQHTAMLVGAPSVFAAKSDEIAAGIEQIEAVRDFWMAEAELFRALSGAAGQGNGPSDADER